MLEQTRYPYPLKLAAAAFLPAALLLLLFLCGCGPMATRPDLIQLSHTATPALRTGNGASGIVPGRFLVVSSDPGPSGDTERGPILSGLHVSIVQTTGEDDDATFARLSAQPGAEFVLRDRFVEGHPVSTTGISPPRPIGGGPGGSTGTPDDELYHSPQGWAVVQAGGYGDASTPGPWTRTTGAGVRIAILDSGVDRNHPDITPNLALNVSEVDQTALPSLCDDGSPQDQDGHGTWTASLAAGAAGPGTGGVIGVAPNAALLNIKVLERMPLGDNRDLAQRCLGGQTAGLLSWVLQGIDDAVTNRADIISLSLGSIIDLNTADGAGWKTLFDRATHAASAAGVVVIAAAGNDGLDLSGGRLLELPAQARDVLAVVASTNPACAEDRSPGAACHPGPVTRAFYSNHGSNNSGPIINAIAAPGGSYPNISDTAENGWVRGACSASACFHLGPSSYVQAMGTSASAPLTAGAAALFRASHPNATAAQTIYALGISATNVHGMAEPLLNTAAALALP